MHARDNYAYTDSGAGRRNPFKGSHFVAEDWSQEPPIAENATNPRARSVSQSSMRALVSPLLAYLAVTGFVSGGFLIGGAQGTLIHLGGTTMRATAIKPEPVANMIDPMMRTISAHQRTFSTSPGANGATEADFTDQRASGWGHSRSLRPQVAPWRQSLAKPVSEAFHKA